MRYTQVLLIYLLSAIALSAAGTIELVGVFTTSQKALLAFTDANTERSAWVAVGENFEGYTVSSFDPGQETATLTKGAEVLKVRLKEAKIKEGRIEIAGTVSVGSGKAIAVTSATLIYNTENSFPVGDGVILRITPKLRSDGTVLYQSVFDVPGGDGKREVLSAPAMIARPDQQFSLHVGDYDYSFKPKKA